MPVRCSRGSRIESPVGNVAEPVQTVLARTSTSGLAERVGNPRSFVSDVGLKTWTELKRAAGSLASAPNWVGSTVKVSARAPTS